MVKEVKPLSNRLKKESLDQIFYDLMVKLHDVSANIRDTVYTHCNFANRLVKDYLCAEIDDTSCQVRPAIEALFFERNDLFLRLLKALLEKNDEQCYLDFFHRLNGAEQQEKSSLDAYRLCEFDDEVQDKLQGIVVKLALHPHKPIQNAAIQLSLNLSLLKPLHKPLVSILLDKQNVGPALQLGFRALQLKLETLHLLYKVTKQPESQKSRYYLLNSLSMLLLGIPFLINYLYSGQVFFAQKNPVKAILMTEERIQFSIPSFESAKEEKKLPRKVTLMPSRANSVSGSR